MEQRQEKRLAQCNRQVKDSGGKLTAVIGSGLDRSALDTRSVYKTTFFITSRYFKM